MVGSVGTRSVVEVCSVVFSVVDGAEVKVCSVMLSVVEEDVESGSE